MPTLVINEHEYALKLVLFDVDGTLVDDIHRYRSLGKARYSAFNELSSENAALEWARLSGVNPEDWSIDPMGPISKAPRRDDLALAAGALYLDGFSWYEARQLAEKIYEKADYLHQQIYTPKLYEGVREKLIELKEKGFKLGLATNGVTRITKELVSILNISHLFEVVVGADMVEEGKPAPDVIILACDKAGFQTSDCMYVGDQPTDMEAANQAGVKLSLIVGNIESNLREGNESIKSIRDINIFDK